MPVSVSIEPFSPSIDMYDSPHASSAYSLSGHIVISLTPSSSLLGLSRPAPQNLLLTSLELSFEGQSELVLNEIGYVPLRLISLTKDLVSEPVSISADNDHAEWRVVFDLPIPGWLPPTSVFGDDEQHPAGVSYNLFARAHFLTASPDLDDAPGIAGSSVWNNLCAAVRFAPSRARAVYADCLPIVVTRYVSSPPNGDEFPCSAYAIQVADATTNTTIPFDILRTLEVQAVVPSRTSLTDSSIPLVLRMRAPGGDGRLCALSFEADITQMEEFRASPSASYSARFPLPPAAQQPPVKPLTTPHPVSALFDLGFVGLPNPNASVTYECSLAPAGANKVFRVRGADTAAHTHGVPLEDSWVRMEVPVPIVSSRTTGESPFLKVRHELRVRLAVGYDGGSMERTTSDELVFGVPLEFVRLAPPRVPEGTYFHTTLSTASLPLPHPAMGTRASSPARSLSALGTRPRTATPPPALPAYSQLFYDNGDRKDDSALPLYREKEEAETSSSSGFESDSDAEPGSSSSSSSSFSSEPDGDAPQAAPSLCERKFGESFLPFDDDAGEDQDEEVQYGVAI